MRSKFIVLFILLLTTAMVYGQNDITFTKMGIQSCENSSDNESYPGDSVSVAFEYDYTDVSNPNRAYTNVGSGNIDDKIVVLWYSGSNWSSASYEGFTDSISVEEIATSGSDGSGSGTLGFYLPNAPTGGNTITYYQIFFGLSAPDGFSTYYGDQNTSGKDFAGYTAVNDAPTGYYTHMEYIYDTSTEIPTLDKPLSNATIITDHTIQYDQPETASESTVKLTYTRTGGTADADSPHILEVASEECGNDITLTISADDLGGSTGVTLDSGGNTLVQGAIYTVKISYKDEAGNDASSDEAPGVIWSTCSVEGEGHTIGDGTLTPGTNDQVFFRVDLWYTGSGDPDLTSITFRPSDDNTSIGSDFLTDGFSLWSSSDDNLDASDDNLGAQSYSSAITFPGISVAIPSLSSKAETYLFLTADVASGASTDHILSLDVQTRSDITLDDGNMDASNFPLNSGNQPLPVVLSQFSVAIYNSTPFVKWTTYSETNNQGWNVYKSISKNYGQAEKLNSTIIEGEGTTTAPTDYSFEDQTYTDLNSIYWYWIESIDFTGDTELYGPISFSNPQQNNPNPPSVPEKYGLLPNFPNPFNPSTEIKFQLKENTYGKIEIYNLKGQFIKKIFDGQINANEIYTIPWYGKDNNGKNVASGVYLTRLKTDNKTYVRRIILAK